MKHYYSSTLSALLLLLVSTLSWAADFKKDRIYYNINDEGTSVEVTFGTDTRRPDTKEYTGDIVIPSTVKHKGKTYSVTSIGKSAFSDCTSLASVDIPEGVTSIGDCAFEGCTSLTSITVAPGNSVYDSRQGCNAIIETKTNTLVTGCRNTVIPESVTCIGYNAFRGCYALESIDIPEGVTSTGDKAFMGCSSLTSISLPKGVTRISNCAFMDCRSLTSISIPEGVTSIEDNAFNRCTSLASIDIPEGVRYIGEYTFERCASLAKVICRAERVPYASNGAFLRTPIGKAKLYVPASSIEAYKAANGWKGFGTILPLEDDKSNTE